MRSTLNLLPLPTPALPGSGVCFKSEVGSSKLEVRFDFRLRTFDFRLNNGYDLSLSFSLIAQSKAPLENYGAKVFFYFGIRMLDIGFVRAADLLAKAEIPAFYFIRWLKPTAIITFLRKQDLIAAPFMGQILMEKLKGL